MRYVARETRRVGPVPQVLITAADLTNVLQSPLLWPAQAGFARSVTAEIIAELNGARTELCELSRAGATGARVVARPARTEGASARTCERRAGGLRRGVGLAAMRADQAAAEAPAPPKRARRPAMISSASAMIRSTSSFTVGTSWISAWMVPAVQIPASTSPV